jgi:alkylation response protein AidB-like acyl-CoA dehydrogenase
MLLTDKLTPPPRPTVRQLATAAEEAGEDIALAIELARDCGESLPLPGQGKTQERWATLAAVASVNLTAARVLEPHADALAIMAEAAEVAPPGLTWGVFAAESPGTRLEAVVEHGAWYLTGEKPWCSLADQLDGALVTAHVGAERRLFRVDLKQAGVEVAALDCWVARGLRRVTSGPVTFARASAAPVGEAGWYLERPGFAWGGMGVAACWFGGAQGLGRAVSKAAKRGELAGYHRGVIDAALYSCGVTLADAARRIDHGRADGKAGTLLALRVRAIAAECAETVLRHAAHALGPTPLAFDEAYARLFADLQMYVRQHHGERDLAELGNLADVADPFSFGTDPPFVADSHEATHPTHPAHPGGTYRSTLADAPDSAHPAAPAEPAAPAGTASRQRKGI